MLGIKLYENVFLTRTEPKKDSRPNFSLGAFNEKGEPLGEFSLKRAYGKTESTNNFNLIKSSEIVQLDKSIYGGVLFGHFGHFLVETLSKMWFIKDMPSDLPIVFHCVYQEMKLKTWQKKFLNY